MDVERIRKWWIGQSQFADHSADLAEAMERFGRQAYQAWLSGGGEDSLDALYLLTDLLEEEVAEAAGWSVSDGTWSVAKRKNLEALKELRFVVGTFQGLEKFKQAKQLVREAAAEFCADFEGIYGRMELAMYWAQHMAAGHMREACQLGAQDAADKLQPR